MPVPQILFRCSAVGTRGFQRGQDRAGIHVGIAVLPPASRRGTMARRFNTAGASGALHARANYVCARPHAHHASQGAGNPGGEHVGIDTAAAAAAAAAAAVWVAVLPFACRSFSWAASWSERLETAKQKRPSRACKEPSTRATTLTVMRRAAATATATLHEAQRDQARRSSCWRSGVTRDLASMKTPATTQMQRGQHRKNSCKRTES